jgi:hypothetical protein
VYELLADTWTRSAASPSKDEAAIVVEGARLFPSRLKLIYQGAVVCAKADLPEAAYSLVDHGIKYAPDAAVRGRFEALKQALPPAPAAMGSPAKK